MVLVLAAILSGSSTAGKSAQSVPTEGPGMKMKCPHCGVSGSADASLSGRRVKCPKCSNIFLVPHRGNSLSSPLLWGDDQTREVDTTPAGPIDHGLREQGGAIDGNGEPDHHSADRQTLNSNPALSEDNEHLEIQDNQQDEAVEIQPGPDVETELSPDDMGAGSNNQGQDQPLHREMVEEELQAELDGLLAGTCIVCGKSVDQKEGEGESGDSYCHNCLGKDFDHQELNDTGVEKAAAPPGKKFSSKSSHSKDIRPFSRPDDFSAGHLIKESWAMTNGVKGSLWTGIVVMFLVVFSLGAGAVYMLTHWGGRAGIIVAVWLNLFSQLFSAILSIIFLSGLINIAIKRVGSQSFSWTLVFSGFSRLGSILIAGFLMLLLITSGFLLLVLPGIYLAVGYSLTLPLIMDKGAGPWEAMEMSRRAIHDKWWQVFGAYLVMYLLYFLSMIPFGIGMIWTVPMFFMLTAVLYRVLFGQDAD